MCSTMKLSWTQIKPILDPKAGAPCARSSHGLSFIGGTCSDGGSVSSGPPPRLILHGGEAIARTPIADPTQATWAADYSPESDGGSWKWRSIVTSPPSPPPRVAHAQAVVDNKVYIFGGRMGIKMEEKALNDMWVLDATGEAGTESWSEVQYDVAGGDAPPDARSFHKMVAIGTNLYVFGGCGASGRLADLHKFDTTSNKWTDLGKSSILKGRGGANLIVLDGNKLAVVAGFAGEETIDGHVFCDTCSACDAKWEDSAMDGLKEMRPRSVCVSASFPSKGIAMIFGGEVDPSERGHEGAGGFENDVVILDIKTGAVKVNIRPTIMEAEWPEERGWSDGVVGDIGTSGPSLFVFGGLSGDDKDPRRLGDLWQCNIEE